MSVLIKGGKMPRCCEECPLNYDYYRCNALGDRFDDREEIVFETQRLSDCPLVEVPPHGRLIDADKLKEHKYHDSDRYENAVSVAQIDWAPTVIESEEE